MKVMIWCVVQGKVSEVNFSCNIPPCNFYNHITTCVRGVFLYVTHNTREVFST